MSAPTLEPTPDLLDAEELDALAAAGDLEGFADFANLLDPPEDAWEDICVECGNDHACLGYILCSDCLEDEEISGAYEDSEAHGIDG